MNAQRIQFARLAGCFGYSLVAPSLIVGIRPGIERIFPMAAIAGIIHKVGVGQDTCETTVGEAHEQRIAESLGPLQSQSVSIAPVIAFHFQQEQLVQGLIRPFKVREPLHQPGQRPFGLHQVVHALPEEDARLKQGFHQLLVGGLHGFLGQRYLRQVIGRIVQFILHSVGHRRLSTANRCLQGVG